MTDRHALLAAVLDNPADDTARLVLADWLDEHGEPGFARFLRAGVVAAGFRDAGLVDDPAFSAALRDIADACGSGEPAAWVSALGLGPSPLTPGDWAWDNTADRVTVRTGTTVAEFERGMLAGLTVKLDEWDEAAGRALAVWPLERVTVRDVPGLTFSVDPPSGDRPTWRLAVALVVRPRRTPRGGVGRLVNLLGLAAGLFGLPAGPADPPAEPARWSGEYTYPDRPALVAAAAVHSAGLANLMHAFAGGWWPGPTGG